MNIYRSVELIVFVSGFVLALNAFRNGYKWISVLLSAMVFGFAVEYLLVYIVKPAEYAYPQGVFWIEPCGIPLWIAVGWGSIIYCCAWTTEALKIRGFARPIAAGLLALNADLSLDPIATDYGMWHWATRSYIAQCDLTNAATGIPHCWGLPPWEFTGSGAFAGAGHDSTTTGFHFSAAPNLSYYNVPFHNFIAWFAIVATYVSCTEVLFAITKNWNGRKIPGPDSAWPVWVQLVVPPASVAASFGVLLLIELLVQKLHFNDNALLEIVVLVGAMLMAITVLFEVLLTAKRTLPSNLPTLLFALLFHVLAFVLALVHLGRQPTLPIAILMNFTFGFLAFSWPFQRRLAEAFGLSRLFTPAPEE